MGEAAPLARIGALVIIGLKRGVGLHIKQSSDRLDPVAPNAVSEEACVANPVEARGQDMDQEATNELLCGKPHDLHPIPTFDAIVFPSESHGVSIGTDQAMV